jgi:hypothetical protein
MYGRQGRKAVIEGNSGRQMWKARWRAVMEGNMEGSGCKYPMELIYGK